MDFFEDIFDFEGKKRKKHGEGKYDKHHGYTYDYDHDHDHYHDHHERNDCENNFNQGNNGSSQQYLCPRCSANVMQGAKFCQNCGVSMNTAINCVKCGTKITSNASFCPECGNKLK